MSLTFRLHGLKRETAVAGAGLALLMLVAGGCAHSDECQAVPVDEFSAKIDPLLTAVEGPGFPDAENLASWNERRGDIRANFGDILGLTVGDTDRRRAAIYTLLAAETLSASYSEAIEMTGSERGEARGWARHVLKSQAAIGITREDQRLVDAGITHGLVEAWKSEESAQRSLPLYEEKAAALRALASFETSPECEPKP